MGVINAQQLEIKYKIDSSKVLNEVEMRSRRSTFKRRSKGYKQVKPYSLIDGKVKACT